MKAKQYMLSMKYVLLTIKFSLDIGRKNGDILFSRCAKIWAPISKFSTKCFCSKMHSSTNLLLDTFSKFLEQLSLRIMFNRCLVQGDNSLRCTEKRMRCYNQRKLNSVASHPTLQMNNLFARRSISHGNVSCKLSILLLVNNSGELHMKNQINLLFGRKEVVTQNSEISNL